MFVRICRMVNLRGEKKWHIKKDKVPPGMEETATPK